MRRSPVKFAILLLSLILLVPSSALSAPALSAPSVPDRQVVRAVMFWSDGCPFCGLVLRDTLPPLQEKFGDDLEILLIELVTLDDIDQFYRVGEALGLPKAQVVLPFLLIGDRVLIGVDQIAAELPGQIDTNLAAGGVDYPELSGLEAMLPAGIPFTAFEPERVVASEASDQEPRSSGMALAWVIMVGMLVALVYAGVLFWRGFQGVAPPALPDWLETTLPLLSLVGLGVALYLTYVETTRAPAICGPIGDCNAVQNSPYARLFGWLPVGLLGAAGYLAILVAWLWQRFRSDRLAEYAPVVVFGMALFGTLFSVYLTYLELFVIHAVCIWCLSSAVIITLQMLVALGPAARWLAVMDEEA